MFLKAQTPFGNQIRAATDKLRNFMTERQNIFGKCMCGGLFAHECGTNVGIVARMSNFVAY